LIYRYSQQAGYASLNRSTGIGSPHKYARPPAAGLLNAKTLAEENLKGFRLKNLQKESDLPLRVNQPQRNELPIYFNTPKRKEDIMNNKRLKDK
jgi:hypothetical protein